MARTRVVRAFSAGGVVFRRNAPRADARAVMAPHVDALSGIEIALVGRTAADIWVLPKGTPNAGETTIDVALREVREETGLVTEVVGELGSIHYFFTRAGVRYSKEVFHYLLLAVGGDVSLHDHEYDEARWFPIAEAERRLTFANEANLLRRAMPVIARVAARAGDLAAGSPPSEVSEHDADAVVAGEASSTSTSA